MADENPKANGSRRWFEQGIAALQRSVPDVPPVYACPLCLMGYEDPEALSVEDVPPKSVGGQPRLLTCRRCNSTAGHALDVHIRRGKDLREIAAGRREVDVRLRQFGHTVTARARFGPDAVEIAGIRERSSPDEHRGWHEALDAAAASGSRDWDLSLDVHIKYSPRREAVAWLRVAYLIAFAALGYRDIFRTDLDSVRDQIARPDEDIARGLVKSADGLSETGIRFVHEPLELHSVLVMIHGRLVFLPGLTNLDGFVERVSGHGGKLKMTGLAMDVPTKPQLKLDFQPGLLRLMFPPQQ